MCFDILHKCEVKQHSFTCDQLNNVVEAQNLLLVYLSRGFI